MSLRAFSKDGPPCPCGQRCWELNRCVSCGAELPGVPCIARDIKAFNFTFGQTAEAATRRQRKSAERERAKALFPKPRAEYRRRASSVRREQLIIKALAAGVTNSSELAEVANVTVTGARGILRRVYQSLAVPLPRGRLDDHSALIATARARGLA